MKRPLMFLVILGTVGLLLGSHAKASPILTSATEAPRVMRIEGATKPVFINPPIPTDLPIDTLKNDDGRIFYYVNPPTFIFASRMTDGVAGCSLQYLQFAKYRKERDSARAVVAGCSLFVWRDTVVSGLHGPGVRLVSGYARDSFPRSPTSTTAWFTYDLRALNLVLNQNFWCGFRGVILSAADSLWGLGDSTTGGVADRNAYSTTGSGGPFTLWATCDFLNRAIVNRIAIHDVACINIIAPAGTVNQGTVVTPQATVRNNGGFTETFKVRFDIADGYIDSLVVTSLAPGATTTISFSSWTANTVGTWATKCSTRLAGDAVPGNDKAASTVVVRAPGPHATVFVAHFVKPDSTPWPFDLTISDGSSVQRFDSVTYVCTPVAESATYTWEWRRAGHAVLNEAKIPTYGADTLECFFYAIAADSAIPRVRPYLFFQEKGANASLSWTWDSIAETLGVNVQVTPNKNLDIAVWLDDDVSQTPNWALATCGKRQTWFFPGWDWRFNFPRNYDFFSFKPTRIADTLIAVGFRRAKYNCAIVETDTAKFVSTLWDLSGAVHPPQYTYPQYAVAAGHYVIKPLSIPEDFVKLRLPIMPQLGRPVVIDYLPVTISDLRPFSFSVVGKFTLAACTCAQLQHDPGSRTLSATVSTDFSGQDWWGCFVLPDTLTVATLIAVDSLGDSIALHSQYDYTTDRVAAYNCVAVRIGPQYAKLHLKYAPPETGWVRKADVPLGPKSKRVKDGGCIAYKPDSTGEYVYALKGNNRCEFYKYSPITNTWASMESIPARGRSGKKKAVKKGAAIAAYPIWQHTKEDKDTCWFVGCVKGNNSLEFWRYDPHLSGTPTYPWTQFADIPAGNKAVKEGCGMVRIPVHDSMYYYLLKGSGTQEFYRYKYRLDAWERMADAPLGTSGKTWKNGSCIAYDSIGKMIYALKGSYNELHAYDVATNTWTQKASLPLIGSGGRKKKVKDGAGLAYLGGKLFAQKGGNTREFWSYSTDSTDGGWTQTEDMPVGGGKPVKGGGAMCAGANSIYSLKGNNTLEFYSFTPATFSSWPAGGSNTELSSLNPPTAYALSITPNPFSRTTEINYSLPRAGSVGLRLYDVSGALVRTLVHGRVSAGSYATYLDATKFARGIYFLKLETEGYNTTNKLIIE
jgi:hypothetical protein